MTSYVFEFVANHSVTKENSSKLFGHFTKVLNAICQPSKTCAILT